MAQRRRGRLKKELENLQIDAASKELAQFGLSVDVVSRTIKHLLNVYGDDGWFFIEEAGYKLVIDTILQGGNKENVKRKDKEAVNGTNAVQTGEQLHDETGLHCEVIADELQSGTGEPTQTQEEAKGHGHGLPIITEDSDLSILQQPTIHVMARDALQQQLVVVPSPRRPPCYGWISESESEE